MTLIGFGLGAIAMYWFSKGNTVIASAACMSCIACLFIEIWGGQR